MFFARASEFLITPNIALLIYTLLVLTGVIGTAVTAAKGRWGWLVIDLVTLGIAGNLTAFVQPAPRSVWDRRSRRKVV